MATALPLNSIWQMLPQEDFQALRMSWVEQMRQTLILPSSNKRGGRKAQFFQNDIHITSLSLTTSFRTQEHMLPSWPLMVLGIKYSRQTPTQGYVTTVWQVLASLWLPWRLYFCLFVCLPRFQNSSIFYQFINCSFPLSLSLMFIVMKYILYNLLQ